MVRLAFLAIAWWLTAAGVAQSQVTSVPKELVLYVHQDLEADEVVRQLVCEFSAVLVAPVRASPADMPIDLSLVATGNRLDSERLIRRFNAITERQFGPNSFGLLLIPYYLQYKATSSFGTTFGIPWNMGVVSIGALTPPGTDLAQPEVSKLVARRAFTISLRYVAHMAGLWNRDGCVPESPDALTDIGRKLVGLCDDDRSLLIGARVMKVKPSAPCSATAMVQ